MSGGAQGFGGYQPSNAGSHARHDVSGYFSLETNLTDKLYADSLYRGFYAPGAARAMQLSLKHLF